MIQQSLVNYIRDLLNRGYDINSIRTHLINSGYPPPDIDEAINYIYNVPPVKHVEIPKKAILIGAAAVAAVLFIVFIGFSIASAPAPPSETVGQLLLDVSLEPSDTEISQGEKLEFVRDVTNIGAKRQADVTLRHEVLSADTNDLISMRQETVSLVTRSSSKASVIIPKSTPTGSYILRTTVSYAGQSSEDSFNFAVKKTAPDPTCFDGIKNQGEEDVDCGGPCTICPPPMEEGCGICDDGRSCTRDRCVDSECVYEDIIPCCGNLDCEDNEDSDSCPADCPVVVIPPSNEDTIKNAEQLALSDIERAAGVCDSITKARDHDQCFSSIADISSNNNLCDNVNDETKRDTCLMNFAIGKNDFTVCEKLTNRYLKNSCNSLRNLRSFELQQEQA